jgi:uncharacterized Zn finger protein (UPF0148 family)
MCPECDEEYLVEVREPGVPEPVEVFCPSCGYTAEPEERSEDSEESVDEDYSDDLDGIPIDNGEEDY